MLGKAGRSIVESMISKEAIAYDLREAHEHIAGGQTNAARKQIVSLLENLDLLLHPPGGPTRLKTESQSCGADEFGRDNVRRLGAFCDQAIKVMAHRDRDRAGLILDNARKFWDGLETSAGKGP
jgi:hypothetical protein